MATGTYHKFNYLKFRILEALFDTYPSSLTFKEIAEKGDIELKKVADALNHYMSSNYSYITRFLPYSFAYLHFGFDYYEIIKQ
jgi:hypothetical protein